MLTYGHAGADGYGGSSYIDDVVARERDTNANGSLDERNYSLHNWRHDVVAIINYDGTIRERVTYDAYGRPHAFSPGDIKTGGGADRPDGTLNSSDTWTTGSVIWNKDLGNSGHVAIPDGVTSNGTSNTDDPATLVNLKAAGYSAGYGILSDSAVGNRRGFAGYEFDPILEGGASGDNKPIYHVRHRVLASDTGKWFQKDPLGYHDSMDLYEYCGSDPVDKGDAWGLVSANINMQSQAISFACCSLSAKLFSIKSAFRWSPDDNWNRKPDDWSVPSSPIPVNPNQTTYEVCRVEAIFNPLSNTSSVCDQYSPSDEYSGSSARCFCKCAGNDPWSSFVRTCLRCMYNLGIDPDTAHSKCYAMADEATGTDFFGRPWDSLLACYAKCTAHHWTKWPFQIIPYIPTGPIM